MGPNSISSFSTPGALAIETGQPGPASTKASATDATTSSGVKIKYGDAIKSDRLQAGLQALQAAQAKTGLFIRTINPDIGTM